ncbi:serine/threonine protein kinase [Eggerthella sinensis]|uniref:serine/threonine protein kinase n=1 Tax=Eggerthella sinensis TaxID=242230 RepID=UPI00266BD65B|nr:protein kinase [Eggerthella sinensis]
MSSFSRLSKTIDYSSFSVTKEPGSISTDGAAAFAPLDPAAHPSIGEYRVEEAIDSSGAQADVYAVRKHGQRYAMKVYRKGFVPAPEVQQLLAKGECPHVARLVESGRYRGEYWYEVYPYYSSGTLDDMIARNGKCLPSFIEKVLIPALDEALHYLHSHNLVHADVKPQNIFVSDDARDVVLGDYGVAGLMPSKDRLVPFRGTLEYAPYTLHSGDKVRIDGAYDYGALGLVLVKAYTGYSMFAGMTLEERDEAVIDLHVPESIPAKPRSLIEGLLRAEPRQRYGHKKCREFVEGYQPLERYALRRGRGRFASVERESRKRSFEFGYFDGHMVIVDSKESLLEACESHWGETTAAIDTMKMKEFLRSLTGGDDFYDRYVDRFRHRPSDQRVFWLCCGLRLETGGAGDHSMTYKGRSFPSIVQLMRQIGSERPSDMEDLLDGRLVSEYLNAFGYGAAVAQAAEEILDLRQPPDVKARMLVAICDGESGTIHIAGELIDSVEKLLVVLMAMSVDDVNALVRNPSLKPWLHKHRCDFVIQEMEAFDE